MRTMWQLERDLLAELNDNRSEILAEQYPEDRITEMVDGWIPVYNYQLAELWRIAPPLVTGQTITVFAEIIRQFGKLLPPQFMRN